MLEKNELPIVIPTVTAYHRVSFAMAVLIANHRYHFCMNNYINVFMHPDYIKGNDNNFLNFVNTDIYKVAEFEVDTLKKNNITFDDVISCIDNGKYLFFNNINEHYIMNARYEGKDFPHNIFVYGYDKNEGTVSVMGYDKTTKMALYKTPFEALHQSCNSVFGETDIRTVSLRQDKKAFIDLDMIRKGFSDYLESRPYSDNFTERNVFGVDAVMYLMHYLKCIEVGIYDKNKFDLKMFRLVSDHKQLMRKRLQVLSEIDSSMNGMADELSDIIAMSEKVRALSLKFFASGKEMLLQNMQKYLKEMIEKEQFLYSKILEKFDALILKKNEMNTEISLDRYFE